MDQHHQEAAMFYHHYHHDNHQVPSQFRFDWNWNYYNTEESQVWNPNITPQTYSNGYNGYYHQHYDYYPNSVNEQDNISTCKSDLGSPNSESEISTKPGRTRTRDKYRVVYSEYQRLELEKEYIFNNKYITTKRKAELSAKLGLSSRQIKIWFQNRRVKDRKLNKRLKDDEEMQDTVDYIHL